MSLSYGSLRPYHELLYVILLIIGWLWPYLRIVMILSARWLHPCLGSIYMIILWMVVSIPGFMYYSDFFSDVYVSMLACRFSNDKLWFPAYTCKEFHPTLVQPSCLRGHLLHSILSLSLYSPFLDPGGPLQWTLHAFHHEETPIMSLFMSKTFPFCTISQESSFYPNLQDQH